MASNCKPDHMVSNETTSVATKRVDNSMFCYWKDLHVELCKSAMMVIIAYMTRMMMASCI